MEKRITGMDGGFRFADGVHGRRPCTRRIVGNVVNVPIGRNGIVDVAGLVIPASSPLVMVVGE